MRVIVEGVKLAGKSTVSRELRKRDRQSTVIEFRAYFEPQSDRVLSRDVPRRLRALGEFLQRIPDESVILVRSHLFPFALAAAYGTAPYTADDFNELDQSFAESGFTLALLTIGKQTFNKRLVERELAGRQIRKWDSDWENSRMMQRKYHDLLKHSMMRSTVIRTDNIEPFDVASCIMNNGK